MRRVVVHSRPVGGIGLAVAVVEGLAVGVVLVPLALLVVLLVALVSVPVAIPVPVEAIGAGVVVVELGTAAVGARPAGGLRLLALMGAREGLGPRRRPSGRMCLVAARRVVYVVASEVVLSAFAADVAPKLVCCALLGRLAAGGRIGDRVLVLDLVCLLRRPLSPLVGAGSGVGRRVNDLPMAPLIVHHLDRRRLLSLVLADLSTLVLLPSRAHCPLRLVLRRSLVGLVCLLLRQERLLPWRLSVLLLAQGC